MRRTFTLMLVFVMLFTLAMPAWASAAEGTMTPPAETMPTWPGWPTFPLPPIVMPMDPAMPMDPGQSMEPTMPMDPAMPMEPMDPAMPMEPGQSMEPTMPMDPAMPMEPMDPAMPMEPGQSMEPTMPMDPAMPMEPMDPAMPMEPGQSMESTMPMDPGMNDMPGMGSGPGTGTVEVIREAGTDRFGTAVAASRSKFDTASAVVLANGYSFADALTASGLAGVVGGPVLLTRTDQVPANVLDEISRLGASKVYLIGSTSVISAGVATALQQAGYTVERVGGANRYATAAAVAGKIDTLTGGVTRAFVVNGQVPWDALAASPYAFSQRIPILFVSNVDVPAETAQAIADVGITSLTVVGGTPVVSAATYSSVTALSSGSDARVSGPTRYDTAHALAHEAIAKGWATAAHPGIAAADKSFADALVGGPVAGANGSVLLFSRQGDLTDASRQLLTDHASHVSHVAVFGGPSVVSDGVISEIESIVK